MTFSVRPVVLVAEDDFLIRIAASAFLQEQGFDVIEAADGVEAIEIMDSGQAFDLLFSDVQMPQLDGVLLAREVRSRRRETGILLTSGQVSDPDLPVGARFVPKPYNPDQVAATLRMLLAA